MKTSLEKQIDDFNKNKYYKVFTNFLVRIQVTHMLAVCILIANSILFTQNSTAQIIQLILAFIIILHDFDDSYLKKALSKNINKLNLSNKNLEEINKNLNEIATIDFLTNIPNRRYFFDISEKEFHLAKRYNNNYSLLVIDIDYFKMVNDSFGHDVGDEILKLISSTITKSLRKSDIHARIGGEEFAILLLNTDIDGAKLFSDKLKDTVEATIYKNNDVEINVTISVGVTVSKQEDKNIQEIFKRADQALYLAKESGRNRVNIKL